MADIIEVLNLVVPTAKPGSKKLLLETDSISLPTVQQISPPMSDKVRLGQLSQREHEVLQLLTLNKINKEVAVALDISVRTVESHRRRIMEKLGLHSMSELIHLAIRNGIVEA